MMVGEREGEVDADFYLAKIFRLTFPLRMSR